MTQHASFHLRMTGTLTARDAKRHVVHPFTVPEGVQRLSIDFACVPAAAQGLDNMLTLTIFDPHGFRGARHRGGNRHTVQIAEDAATPGYLPGPLPAGEWIVQVDTHRIMPGAPVDYTIEIAMSTDISTPAERALPETERSAARGRGAGWFRGDLHSHTDHSDAGTRTVADLIAAAQDSGLDFLFITDHNTTSSLAALETVGAGDLLVAGGMELTTFWGHALVLGTRRWVDWRIRPGNGAIERVAADAYAAGELFIIAHPNSGGDPLCTGCAWRFGEMMPGTARLVEVWNGQWAGDSNNEASLALWYDWLNQGRRIVATTGSDTHSTADYAAGPGFAVVFADELSEAALLHAIAAGHLYLSSGPILTLEAHGADGTHAMMGDAVGQDAVFEAVWQACPAGAVVRIIANGCLLHKQDAIESGIHRWSMAPGDASWVTAEIRSASGELLVVTNPIYLS